MSHYVRFASNLLLVVSSCYRHCRKGRGEVRATGCDDELSMGLPKALATNPGLGRGRSCGLFRPQPGSHQASFPSARLLSSRAYLSSILFAKFINRRRLEVLLILTYMPIDPRGELAHKWETLGEFTVDKLRLRILYRS